VEDLSFLPDKQKEDLSFLPDKPEDLSFLPDKPKTNILSAAIEPFQRVTPRIATDPAYTKRIGNIVLGGLATSGAMQAAEVEPMSRNLAAGTPEIVSQLNPLNIASGATEKITGVPSNLKQSVLDASKSVQNPLSAIAEKVTPKDMTVGEQMIHGVATSAPMIVPAFAASRLLTAAKFAPRIASLFGIGIDAVNEAFMEGGSAYMDAIKEGKTTEQADIISNKVFLGNAAILPFTNKMQGFFDVGSSAKRLFTGSAIGGGIEEGVQDLIQGVSANKDLKEVVKQLPNTVLVGMGAGLLQGSAVNVYNLLEQGKADKAISEASPQERQAVSRMVEAYKTEKTPEEEKEALLKPEEYNANIQELSTLLDERQKEDEFKGSKDEQFIKHLIGVNQEGLSKVKKPQIEAIKTPHEIIAKEQQPDGSLIPIYKPREAPKPAEIAAEAPVKAVEQPKVEDPLIQEARKYKTAEEFVNKEFAKKPEYGMGHRPSYEGMPPAHNLIEGDAIPKDVYEHPEWSVASNGLKDKSTRESWEAVKKIRNNPEAEITVYRATRKKQLNNGDWITFSKNYAEDSIEPNSGEKVFSFKIKAKDAVFAGDDINEFGYYPKSQLTDIWNKAHEGEGIPATEIKRVADNIQKNNQGISRYDSEAMAKDVIENRKFKGKKSPTFESVTAKETEILNKINPDRKMLQDFLINQDGSAKLRKIIENGVKRGVPDDKIEQQVRNVLPKGKTEPKEPKIGKEPPIAEIPKEQSISDIVRSSKSMIDAQKQIKKELGVDISIQDLKGVEKEVKGGVGPNLRDVLFKDIRRRIKVEKKAEGIDYGLGSISNEDLSDSFKFYEKLGSYTQEGLNKLKELVHSVELAQNYMYRYPDSKPIAEGVITHTVEKMGRDKRMNDLLVTIKKAKNKDKIAEQLTSLDKAERAGIDTAKLYDVIKEKFEKKIFTQEDVDAINAMDEMRQHIKEELVNEITESRVGYRITSKGNRYNIEYKNKKGETINRERITDYQLEKLKEDESYKKISDIKIKDTKELYTFRHLDPETGKYSQRNELLNNYDEALSKLDQNTRALIKEILPYNNWLPHNRMGGKFWVEAYETEASGSQGKKMFSARVPNEMWAKKIAEQIKKATPTSKVSIKLHRPNMFNIPSMGSMADVSLFLDKAGIDPQSVEGQKIMNTYRGMSGLMSSMIHAQDIAGYRVDFDGIVEGLTSKARSASSRRFRNEVKDLKQTVKKIDDNFRAETASNYIDAITAQDTHTTFDNVMDGLKSFAYFSALTNKPTYIIQNLTEPVWTLARAIPEMKNPASLAIPFNSEYRGLIKKAQNEGVLKTMVYEDVGQSLLNKMNVLGNWSEQMSSQKSFEIGLKVARDNGLKGDEAYQSAYQFLFNVAKPFYNKGNSLVGLLKKPEITRHGLIFLRWPIDFINKFVFGKMRVKLLTMLGWAVLAGVGTIPGGKWLLSQLKLANPKKLASNMSASEKFLLGGLPGLFGASPRFLIPLFMKGLGEVGNFTKNIAILSTQAKYIESEFKKYGLLGALGTMPLGGIQYPIAGFNRLSRGFIEKRGDKRKVAYRAQGTAEEIVTGLGMQPFGKYAKENK